MDCSYSSFDPSIHSFIRSFIHSFIHPFIHSVLNDVPWSEHWREHDIKDVHARKKVPNSQLNDSMTAQYFDHVPVGSVSMAIQHSLVCHSMTFLEEEKNKHHACHFKWLSACCKPIFCTFVSVSNSLDRPVSKRCTGLSTCVLGKLSQDIHKLQTYPRTDVGAGTPGRKRSLSEQFDSYGNSYNWDSVFLNLDYLVVCLT